ncbi:MAG TPA: hypothetical protein IGQ44_01710 [Geminocystis sp. M7585_C2015_104]|nr:hypothetical protein [Geminocystis sp. M7585_C2015_104]
MKNKGAAEFKFWLWWLGIRPQKREEGNTLVIAIVLGLLLMVGTSISLLNSSRAKTNAKSSESSQQAMAVAELGVARVHDFLVRNPLLAMHNITQWDSLAGTTQTIGTFTNTSSGTSTCQNIVNASGVSPLTTTVGRFKTDGDLVEENNPRKGAIKVIDYRYEEIIPPASATNGQVYAYGHLTVRGQINPTANNVTEVFADNPFASKSQVKVKIPLRKSNAPFSFPGVWISNQAIGSPTNSIIQANLLVPNCNNMGLQIASGYRVILSPVASQFPPLPTPPADTNPRYYNLGNITSSITLPRSTDEPIETETVTHNGNTYQVKVYKYRVNNISLNGGERITIIPGRKVVLHLYGNISLSGSQVMDNSCTSVPNSYTCNNNTKIVTYHPSGEQSVFRRENLVILGYAQKTGPATSTQPSICLAGGAEIFGFVFAPDYAVGAAGTGNGNGFTGAVWARLFNPPSVCGSNTGQVVVVQDITNWDFLEGVGIRMSNLPPKVDAITQWERKEAN